MPKSETENSPAPFEILPLVSKTSNWENLRKSLSQSNGKALIVVHPFYDQKYLEQTEGEEHKTYKERLGRSVSKYFSEKNFTLILMEEYDRLEELWGNLSKMKIDSGSIFFVPTKVGRSEPIDQELNEFSARLKEAGLNKAIIVGTYFWPELLGVEDKRELKSALRGKNYPNIASKYDLDGGCVGGVISELLEAGVYTIPGRATFRGGRPDLTGATIIYASSR